MQQLDWGRAVEDGHFNPQSQKPSEDIKNSFHLALIYFRVFFCQSSMQQLGRRGGVGGFQICGDTTYAMYICATCICAEENKST